MADSKSKKSKMILVRAAESMLSGMKVAKASRARFESEYRGQHEHLGRLVHYLPCSPSLNSSYASQVTTPPGNLLQHHLRTLHRTIGSVRRNSCAKAWPCNCSPLSKGELKKFLTKVRAALGSEVGRNGRSKNGISSPVRDTN